MPKSVLFDREEVLEKVTRLFWDKGYNGTSMQDLVDATGLNRSSIYNSFGDKFKLFEESLSYYQKKQHEIISTYIAPAKSPKDAIISMFEGIRDEIITGKNNRGCLLTNCTAELSNSDLNIQDFLTKNQKSMVNMFSALIEEAKQAGEIDTSKDARQLALYLFSNLQGLRLISMVDHNDSDIEGVTGQILNNL